VDIIDTMMKIHQYGIMSAPTLSQFAGVEAMDHGDDDIAMMREEYRRRRNYVVSSLNEIGLKTFMPEGAFYVFPDIRSTGLDSQTFAMRMLEDHAVACVPGGAFGACGEGFVRCSYATSMEKLKTAMERFADFAGKLS
jgi:aminotransferase